MEELLSQVYTTAGHYREAMGVHEDVLRLIVEGDGGDDKTVDKVEPEMARKHLDLFKACYLRLKGWDKSDSNYHELVREVLGMRKHKGHAKFKDAVPAKKWSLKEDPGNLGMFVTPLEWRFPHSPAAAAGTSSACGTSQLGAPGPRPQMSLKRASSNWGLGFLHDLLRGQHNDEDVDEKPRMPSPQIYYLNGHSNGVGNGKA